MQELNSPENLCKEAFEAIKTGNLEALQRAVNRGFDPHYEFPDSLGRTPLHKAAESGHLCIVKFLIEKGANVNAKDNVGDTPLHLARSRVMQYLIEKGALVKARDHLDRTPLHRASHKVCRILIENGADVNAEDFNLWRPLHFAAMEGSEEKIYLLRANGADVSAVDLDGNTPCHIAADYGELDSLKTLLPFMKANFCNGQNQTVYDIVHKFHADLNDFEDFSDVLEKSGNSKADRISLTTLPEPRRLNSDLFYPFSDVQLYFGELQISDKFVKKKEARKILSELEETNSKEEYLKKLLEKYAHPRIHWVQDGHSGCEVAVRVQNFVKYFLQEAAGIDPRFVGTAEPIGSCAEGSKLGNPDEFDFLFTIEDLAKAELHFDDSDAGIAEVCFTEDDIQNRWKALLDEDNKLQVDDFSYYFNWLLWETSRRLKSLTMFGFYFRKVATFYEFSQNYPSHAVPLVRRMKVGCKLRLYCQITGLSIDVDVVPAIKFQGWPQQHVIPFEELKKLLPASVTQQEISYFVVPHAGIDTADSFEWQVSFATTEKAIISNCRESLLDALRILKILKNLIIAKAKESDETWLNSYVMKTGFLHHLTSIKKDSPDNHTLTETVLTVLHILRDKLVNESEDSASFCIRSFFVPEFPSWKGDSDVDVHKALDKLVSFLT